MLYKKPKNLKYTTMCMYIDKKVAEGSLNDEEAQIVFEYLYHIAFMLAHKHKYFKESHYYEEFAIYLATDMINRLFYNPKLNKLDENGEPILKPIKSVLNYMKSIIYGRKCVFEKENYSQKITTFDNNLNYANTINLKLKDSLLYNQESNVDIYLETVSSTVKKVVYTNNHYLNDKLLMKNIYISCLLSVVNSFTFTQTDLKNMQNTYTLPDTKYKYIAKLYKLNRDNCTLLYHLDNSFYNYITVLVRKIFNELQKDLVYLSKEDVTISDSVLSDIVFLELDGKVNFD